MTMTKTTTNTYVLLTNAYNWNRDRVSERAAEGDLVQAQHHRGVCAGLLAQLRAMGDAGHRLAAALERDE